MVLSACSRAAAQSANVPPPPKITVAEVISRDVTEWDEFTGRLEAVNTVAVRPRVSGLLSSARFDEGALVKKGDLLFQIDPRPFQAEVDRLRAELERVRATVQRAISELQRADRLSNEDGMSPEERDRRAAFAKESAAQVAAVEAALREAELNLEFTRVTSPIDGRVGRAIVTTGNLVSSGPGEATLLTTVVSLDPIYASFEADEQTFLRYVDLAREGKRASARATVPIHMALASEASRYRALLIQDRAVGTDLDKRYVYVVGSGATIEYRAVQLGPIVDGLRVVRGGLKPSDVIVINGLQHVRPGAQIDPVKVSMEASS